MQSISKLAGRWVLLCATFCLQPAFSSINAQSLRGTYNANYYFLEDALLFPANPKPSTFYAGPISTIQLHTVDSPLVLFDVNGQDRINLIDRLYTLDLASGVYLNERFLLGADLPISAVAMPGSSLQFGVEDPRLFFKYRMMDGGRIGAAFFGEIYLPLGRQDLYLSNGSTSYGFGAVLERDFGLLRLAVNLGYVLSSAAILENVDYRHRMPIGVGVAIFLLSKFSINIEAVTTWLIGKAIGEGNGDIFVGARYQVMPGGTLSLGASLGSIPQDSTASFRALLGLKLARTKEDEARSRTTTIVKTCGIEPIKSTYMARALDSTEIKNLKSKLPYLTEGKGGVPAITLDKLEDVNKSVPSVHNSQVVFAFDVTDLPPRNSIEGIDSISFRLPIYRKTSVEEGKREMFCLVDHKVCSGELSNHAPTKEKINSDFFGGKDTPNDYFLRQAIERSTKTTNPEVQFSKLELDLRRLLENVVGVRALDIIYGRSENEQRKQKRTIYVVAARNTDVSVSATLNIGLRQDTCRISRWKESVSIQEDAK